MAWQSNEGVLHVLDVRSGVKSFSATGLKPLPSISFTRDGTRLVGGCLGKNVHVWDLRTSKPLFAPVRAHDAEINSLSLSTCGTLIATGGADNRVKIWDMSQEGLTERASLAGHDNIVWGVALSADGSLAASAGLDGTVRLWRSAAWSSETRKEVNGEEEVEDSQKMLTLRGHLGWVWSVALNPLAGAAEAASAGDDKTVRLWRTDTGAGDMPPAQACLRGHTDEVRAVVYAPHGDLLLSCSDDATALVWRLGKTPCQAATFRGHQDPVRCGAWTSCAGRVATGGDDASVRLWDVATQQQLHVSGGAA